MSKTWSTALVISMMLVLALLVIPASGKQVGTVINQGATVFIGEEGLDITNALDYPSNTQIGWWSSGASIDTTAPKLIPLTSRVTTMAITQSEFSGYTGNWYRINSSGKSVGLAFYVADPYLDIDAWDAANGQSVNGKNVVQGLDLTFRINTNIQIDANRKNTGTTTTTTTTTKTYVANTSAGQPTYTDSMGGVWIENTTTGATTNGFVNVTVLETSEPNLYNHRKDFTAATGSYTYNGLTTGTYTVTLKYAEMTYSAPGLRVFNVTINGNQVETNFDVFAQSASANKALDKTYLVPVAVDGNLIVKFDKVIGYPMVSAIQVTREITTTTPIVTGTNLNPSTDGFINIKVKSGSGSTYNALYSANGSLNSITDLFVNTSPFLWNNLWATGYLTGSQYAYPPGTYYVSAESTLNNMKENYRNGGADYTGKTVSQPYSVTLTSDTVKLDINKNTVVRGKAFSVILTGKPSSKYHIWLKGIGSMNGTGSESNSVPPQIVNSQEGVFPGEGGDFIFENSGGVKLSQSVPQVSGVNPYFANVTTNNLGGRTIEFSTSSATKAQRYTIRVETDHLRDANAQNDEVDVNVEKGAVTIVAAGDQSYFLGEEIKLSGSNSESYTTYLFIVGPNLPSAGAKLSSTNPRDEPVSKSVYTTAPVNGDNSWSYKWGTSTVALDAGTYTIYAVNLPKDAESLGDATYGTTSVVLKKPFVSAAVSSATVAQGDSIKIIGTAEGDPQQGVAIWVLGKNYNNRKTQSINSDSSFTYEIKGSDTEKLATGQYFIVVQHPMQNTVFDIDVVGDNVVNRELGTGGMTIFKLNGAGSLQGSDAANALIEAIGSPNIDDTYTKFQFIVETPYIYISPIGDKHIGDKFTIKSETNLAVDDQVLVEVYSSSFKPTQKSQSGEFSGVTGTVKVVKGEGNNGLNALKFEVDTAAFRADEYLVKQTAIVQEATGTSLFNILDAGAVPKATATPVATPIVVTVVPTPAPITQEPTPVETVNATAKPTTQASPGFASLYALVGLAAVGFVIVRRD